MSVQVRARREAAAFLSTFVGAQGELLVDTTNNRVQVHDGTTPGGSPAAKLSEVVANTRTAVADASYSVLPTDRNVAITSLTGSRTLTLPAASVYPTGTQLVIFDESGNCSAANAISIARVGTDTINGAASIAITGAYGYLAFESNGAGRWTIVDQVASTGSRTSVADTSYTVTPSDRHVCYTALTAARTVTLPAASTYPVGTRLLVVDESGGCSPSNTITLVRAGSDTINGGATAVASTAYGFIAVQGNGVGKWTITDQVAPGLAANSATNAILAPMPTLTLKANIAGSTANPTDASFSAVADAAFGSLRGQILYRGASGWASLAPGSSGAVLTSAGAGADPTYAAQIQNNYAATTYPGSSNDASQGYGVGSRWLVNATGEMFFCRAATAGAAVWNRADNADFFGYVAGRWYVPFGVSATVSGAAPGAGTMRLFPWVNKQRVTLSALGVRITTVSSGGNVQAALYAADPASKRPTGSPLASTPSMSTTAQTPVNGAVSVQIDPGLYWFATNCDNATAAFTSLANTNLSVVQLMGSATEAGGVGISTFANSFQFAQAFGSWPDLTAQTLTEAANSMNVVPLVHFSVGSVP